MSTIETDLEVAAVYSGQDDVLFENPMHINSANTQEVQPVSEDMECLVSYGMAYPSSEEDPTSIISRLQTDLAVSYEYLEVANKDAVQKDDELHERAEEIKRLDTLLQEKEQALAFMTTDMKTLEETCEQYKLLTEGLEKEKAELIAGLEAIVLTRNENEDLQSQVN